MQSLMMYCLCPVLCTHQNKSLMTEQANIHAHLLTGLTHPVLFGFLGLVLCCVWFSLLPWHKLKGKDRSYTLYEIPLKTWVTTVDFLQSADPFISCNSLKIRCLDALFVCPPPPLKVTQSSQWIDIPLFDPITYPSGAFYKGIKQSITMFQWIMFPKWEPI